eukprot:1386937-Amorphochlora_amoeboformis.AAC.1
MLAALPGNPPIRGWKSTREYPPNLIYLILQFGLIILSLPICAMQWYLHAQAGAYIDPKEWEEKANRGRRKKYALNCREVRN